MTAPSLQLEPFDTGDLPLVQKLVGDPAMMTHLGGPETPQKIADRLVRYRRHSEPGNRMFKIVYSGKAVGSVGYWEREWRGDPVLETGWAVIPAFQGRGIAVAATALALDRARSDAVRRFVHAFPSVENAASNAICRKLGFTLLGATDFEYPPGHQLRCNDWQFDLEQAALAARRSISA